MVRWRFSVHDTNRDGVLVVSLGEVTWYRVVTGVKADADGGLVLTWEWRKHER